jgi:hypothetical protein
MPNCSQTIQTLIESNQLENVTQLYPSVVTPLSITSTIKQLFRIDTIGTETIQFNISLQTTQPRIGVGVTVNFFSIINQTQILSLGSVIIDEDQMSFQKDLQPGAYLICIGSASVSYTGTLTGLFTSGISTARLFPTAYAGSTVEISLSSPPAPGCSRLLLFDMLAGSLPPGVVLLSSGIIFGVLPNMDCLEETEDLSPSQNWYYQIDNTWQPWGNQWRFHVRVWVADYPLEAVDERWFCLRIYNNWSWDKDNFHKPLVYEEELPIEKPEPIILDKELCCEPVEEVVFKPMAIPRICPCEEENSIEQVTVLNFLQWYKDVLLFPNDSPETKAFLDNFKQTELYRSMMDKAGLENSTLTREEKELIAVNALIKQYMAKLDGGRNKDDIDYIMLQNKDIENQKLPLTLMSFSGEVMSIEFRR